jgi:uncharacterized protein YoxC
MHKNIESKSIEQLMAEADELIKKIDSVVYKDLQEKHRIELEKHTQNLKQIQSELNTKIEKKETTLSSYTSSAKGMHEALHEIAVAMKDLAKYLT